MNRSAIAILLYVSLQSGALFAQDDPVFKATDIEFFESRIRPVLIEHCYECHNSTDTTESGLALDYRGGIIDGSDGGEIIDFESPAESQLLLTIRHEIEGMEMPLEGPKLSDEVISDFEKWIQLGAPDPRSTPPDQRELTELTSWEAQLERRKQWWSFQPILEYEIPATADLDENVHPIDVWIRHSLEQHGLQPAEPAEASVLVRRLFLTLTGLPPTIDELLDWSDRIDSLEGEPRKEAIEKLIDSLIDSPRFGERWARHWMDWIRYAESHGSEGDPGIVNAWLYRDYLIRALNEDVKYDQLLREHIAGDLLDNPRINSDTHYNESLIGTAHWRMVFHGFAPTDALDERVRFTDDQINAFSKAFLGLTVSCARCHDHKFDAISQADYYALFGILASCRPARKSINSEEQLNHNSAPMRELKPKIRAAIAQSWLAEIETLEAHLTPESGHWANAADQNSILHPFYQAIDANTKGMSIDDAWQNVRSEWQESAKNALPSGDADVPHRWKFGSNEDHLSWYRYGTGLQKEPNTAGEFALMAAGDAVLRGIYPSGVYTHALSEKHSARFTSPDVELGEQLELWAQVIGGGGASIRYAVQDYPRNGTVYPVAQPNNDWRWQRFDVSYWSGDQIHVELTSGKDAPLLVNNQDRSWFGVREVMLVRKGQPMPRLFQEHLSPILSEAPNIELKSNKELVDHYLDTIEEAIRAWENETANDGQALLLDQCVRQGFLSNRLDQLPNVAPVVQDYRALENDVTVPTRVPSLDETIPRAQHLFVRGDHRKPGDEVPRRFLEAIDKTPYNDSGSGRLQLADDLLRSDNPLTRRVIVNRIWHHLFGRGLVSTPDNFGRLGERPTHPELLDWMAVRFAEDEWSLKAMVRLIVTSETWQQDSRPSEHAQRHDPANLWLSHANVRRLEAEAIRDSLLATSGRLDRTMHGAPVNADSNRRTVYTRVIRNSLDPFLRAFDFPEPFSTVGRRETTNVPAQSLTMMNDERVIRYSEALADRVIDQSPENSDRDRLTRLFLTVLNRMPTESEIAMSTSYLDESREAYETLTTRRQLLEQDRSQLEHDLESIMRPVRDRLLAEHANGETESSSQLPQPIARWEFDDNLEDSIGTAHGKAIGGASLEDGALVVRNGGHVISAPLEQSIKEKTLEAWVILDNLEQRGGGVISLQTSNGQTFDAIVFGEQTPRHWMSGSNFFERTESFQGDDEQQANQQPTQITIVYRSNGEIAAYRNGHLYGREYKASSPIEFRAGDTVVGFGIRHLPSGGNRMLSGRILLAQLYDRALTEEEILATAESPGHFVSEASVLKALPEADRARVSTLKEKMGSIQNQIEDLGPPPTGNTERKVWIELAQTMFMLKEFIYLR